MRMGMMVAAASAPLLLPGRATTTMVGPAVQVVPGRGQSLAAQQVDRQARIPSPCNTARCDIQTRSFIVWWC